MKRWLTLTLAAIMCITFVGCSKSKKITFPFEVSDVKEITVYHFSVPSDAEKKILIHQNEIESMYNMLSSITLKDKEVEPLSGFTTTIFSFSLTDDTTYNVTYCSGDITYGTVNLSDDGTTWYTSANMESLWNSCDVDVVSAEMEQFPTAE